MVTAAALVIGLAIGYVTMHKSVGVKLGVVLGSLAVPAMLTVFFL